MEKWSLAALLDGLHDEIHQKLEIARRTLKHPTSKGDASEDVWLELLQTYLPKRYQAAKAHVVDCQGNFSQQIDIVIFDRQYSPFIFKYQNEMIIPAESVYAVFEAKQYINLHQVEYAKEKVKSVRQLQIRPGMTASVATFKQLWPNIKPFIHNQNVVAHNGAFDFNCLKQTLEFYSLPQPQYNQHCTLKIYGEGLAPLCDRYGIELTHHDALSDAMACAELFLLYLKKQKRSIAH